MPLSRYDAALDPQQQWEPGSCRRVLRNLRGIRSKRVMDRLEQDGLYAAQKRCLRLIGRQSRFTAKLLRNMHQDWLGSIYPWAGEYRTVELAKGGFQCPPSKLVAANMHQFGATTLRRLTPCRTGSLEVVARALAIVHAELLLIHPFRDGNGRLARWLASLMAMQAGLPMPNFGLAGPGSTARRSNYLVAVQRGYVEDFDLLTRFFVDAIRRAEF